MRKFETGATRDTEDGKLDYEGFLSPTVLQAYAEYMHQNRVQADGNLRDSDNWQKGIPMSAYMKSAFRHFIDWWTSYRRGTPNKDAALALLFNVMGFLHEQVSSSTPLTNDIVWIGAAEYRKLKKKGLIIDGPAAKTDDAL